MTKIFVCMPGDKKEDSRPTVATIVPSVGHRVVVGDDEYVVAEVEWQVDLTQVAVMLKREPEMLVVDLTNQLSPELQAEVDALCSSELPMGNLKAIEFDDHPEHDRIIADINRYILRDGEVFVSFDFMKFAMGVKNPNFFNTEGGATTGRRKLAEMIGVSSESITVERDACRFHYISPDKNKGSCKYCQGVGMVAGLAHGGGAATCIYCNGTGEKDPIGNYTEHEKRIAADIKRGLDKEGEVFITFGFMASMMGMNMLAFNNYYNINDARIRISNFIGVPPKRITIDQDLKHFHYIAIVPSKTGDE